MSRIKSHIQISLDTSIYHIILIWIGSQHFALLERILCYIFPPMQVPRAPATFHRQKNDGKWQIGKNVGWDMDVGVQLCV
jgi:hypothetical protein